MGEGADELRIGVIGCGSIGRRHIENLLVLGEREILGCDTAAQTAYGEAIGFEDMRLGVQIVRDVADVWDWQPEAVLICTPPESHESLMWQAYHHDADVFIEKPLSNELITMFPNYDQKALGAGRNWVSMVACNWRFHPGPLALKRWLDEGAIGEVLSARFSVGYYLPDTKPNYKESYAATTGATLDVAWHMADLALWMLGSAKLRSAAVRSAKCIGLEGVDGLASLLLDHDNGAYSIVEGNFVQKNYSISTELIGSKASADWHYKRETAVLRMASGEGLSTGTLEDINTCYSRQLAHFLACIRENKPTCNPVSSAVDVMRILLEAKQCGR